jgi:ATP-dependent DNA helicase PIF1
MSSLPPVDPYTARLAQLNSEQRYALQLMQSGRSCYVSGEAGTGKSFLIETFFLWCANNGSDKPRRRVAKLAPTGTAAVNIGARCTLCAFMGLGVVENRSIETLCKEIRHPKCFKAVKRFRETDTMLIDEVSMLSAEDLEKYSAVMCAGLRKSPHFPFGGKQVVMIGDFAQLPPVFRQGHPDTRWAFESPIWAQLFPPANRVTMSQVIRQKDDAAFRSLLAEMRLGVLSPASREEIGKLQQPLPVVAGKLEPVYLFCTRAEAERHNEQRMRALPGAPTTFEAIDNIQSRFLTSDKLDTLVRAQRTLQLKVGARVMLVANLDVERGLCNGSQGVVTALTPNVMSVTFSNGLELKGMGREKFEYRNASDEVEATRLQFPFVPAFGMTIHKSQSLTLERAVVDLSRCFEYGQAYVAVSRVRRREDLQIVGCRPDAVRTHPKVLQLFAEQQQPASKDKKRKAGEESKEQPAAQRVK